MQAPPPIKPILSTWLADILAERRLEIIQKVLANYPEIQQKNPKKIAAIYQKAELHPMPQSFH
jgi:hypothetical protein